MRLFIANTFLSPEIPYNKDTLYSKFWKTKALFFCTSVSSPLLSSREDDSDSDDDSSDDDVPLRTLIRSKPSLAGSMVSAVTSET